MKEKISKRGKKFIIILISVILVLVCGFSYIFFAGLIPPAGYNYEKDFPYKINWPVTYGDEYKDKNNNFILFIQFNEMKDSDFICFSFVYEDEMLNLNSIDSEWGVFAPCKEFYVEKKDSKEKIGSFITPKKDYFQYGFVFFEGDYLYYILCKSIQKSFFNGDITHQASRNYTRYEEYCFNLKTGENKKIPLKVFYEKLSMIDNTIALRG